MGPCGLALNTRPLHFEEAFRTLLRRGHAGEHFGQLVDAQVPLPVEHEHFARVHLRENPHGVGTLEAPEPIAHVLEVSHPRAVHLFFVGTLGVAREGLPPQVTELGLHVERLALVVLRGWTWQRIGGVPTRQVVMRRGQRRSDQRLAEPTGTGSLNRKTTR